MLIKEKQNIICLTPRFLTLTLARPEFSCCSPTAGGGRDKLFATAPDSDADPDSHVGWR
jgi:hypothetical protein